jgi:hypothetical protein
MIAMGRKTEEQRFWAKVNRTEDCWLWTGSKFQSGAGQFKASNGLKTAAQFSWVLHYGPIPPGQRVKTICGDNSCIRPDHLTTGAEGRFWMKVNKDGPVHPSFGQCWIWTGAVKTHYGQPTYGTFTDDDGQYVTAHRFSYQLRYGFVPPELDHKCQTKLCVRPEHLRDATRKQNRENMGAQRNSQSGIRGVYPKRGGWYVEVKHNGKTHWGGSYTDLDEAERAAINLRNILYTHNDADRQ